MVPNDSVCTVSNAFTWFQMIEYIPLQCWLMASLWSFQEEIQAKDAHHAEEVNGLKTEIATLKLNRLVSSGSSSPRLGSAHKGELDRLNEELTAKSLMIVELRKEIALLKVEVS